MLKKSDRVKKHLITIESLQLHTDKPPQSGEYNVTQLPERLEPREGNEGMASDTRGRQADTETCRRAVHTLSFHL